MLRYNNRWHDAANSPPLHGEARLLWFAAKQRPTGSTPDNDDDEEGAEEATQVNAADTQAQDGVATSVQALREFDRRQAKDLFLNAADTEYETVPKTNDVVANVESLEQTLSGLEDRIENIVTNGRFGAASESQKGVVSSFREGLTKLRKRSKDHAYTLETLKLNDWEGGKMTPRVFLSNYEKYIANMKTLDDMDPALTKEEKTKREALRTVLLEETRAAVEFASQKKPAKMAMDKLAGLNVPDQEIWDLYDDTEKDGIMRDINAAAGLDELKINIQDDVDSIQEILKKKDVADELLRRQKELLEDNVSHFGDEHGDEIPREEIHLPSDVWSTVMSTWTRFNEAAGIEWMTAYEWYESFQEVFEGIKELRKQKSRLRVSRAATQIGRVAALVPGLGGHDLEHILDEQQTHKNDEIKDSYLKELKNNKIDLGFKQLFGEPGGHTGYLQHNALIGDTNKTRAVIEFAAGKGMLYGLEGTTYDTYRFPGNLSVDDVLPREWSREQKTTYWGNMAFSNTQGMASQEKAGEDYVKGRATLPEYLGPFEGAINDMSLSFAKGIANKALGKVKDGEASALMTLIVLDVWKKNALFRKYVPAEWLDRLAGDSKQLLIGMIKYDQKQLLAGARGGAGYETVNLADMEAPPFEPGGPPNKGRLGPLVAAVEKELIRLDSSVAPKKGDEKSEKKFRLLTAKVLACQTVKLPNEKWISIYDDNLRPFHIQYKPDEMRDANVSALGDDFFINQSEITNATAEVVQYVGRVTQEGFAEPTKARYFFSHIIDSYEKLNSLARKGSQKEEFQGALKNFVVKQRENLDQWVERAIQGNGGAKLLTEKHKDQKGRRIVLTLLKQGLISIGVIQRVAGMKGPQGEPARQLLKHYDALGNTGSTRTAELERRKQPLDSAEKDFTIDEKK